MISKTIGYNGVHNIFRHTHFLNPLVLFARFSSWSSWPALGVVPPCWHAVLPGRPAWCRFMPVSVVDMSLCLELGSWGQKMQRKGTVLDCWQFLRCNARNSFPPQCVGRQGRCFHCRCSERRRLFKILKFDFSTFFILFLPLLSPIFERHTRWWTSCQRLVPSWHRLSSVTSSELWTGIGVAGKHRETTKETTLALEQNTWLLSTCRILDLGCSQTLQPVLPRWHVHTSAMRIDDVCQGPKESVCLTCLLSTSPQLYFGHLWTIQGFAKLLRLSLWWPLHLHSACVSDLLGLSDSMDSAGDPNQSQLSASSYRELLSGQGMGRVKN